MWYQKDLQTLGIGHCARWRIHLRIVSQAENRVRFSSPALVSSERKSW